MENDDPALRYAESRAAGGRAGKLRLTLIAGKV